MENMKHLKIFILITLLPFHLSLSQQLDIELEEIFTIGGKEDLMEEYLFVAPQQIFTDSQDNIFLRDVRSTMGFFSDAVNKYSPDGTYISTLYFKGKGPGEYENILCICINHRDELLVYDDRNKRITLFSSDFSNYRIFNPPSNVFLKPDYILPFTQSSYVVVNYSSRMKMTKLFSIYLKDFSQNIENFGDRADIWDQTIALTRLQSRIGALKFVVIDSTKILLAPESYDGELYFYQKSNTHWQFQKINGFKPKLRSYKEIPRSQVMNKKVKIPYINFGEDGKRYSYKLFNKSKGLYSFENKYLIHFSIQYDKKGKYIFVAEIITKHGEYKGYKVLKKYDAKGGPRRNINVIGKSKDGYFLTTEIEGIPAITKIKLKIKNLDN